MKINIFAFASFFSLHLLPSYSQTVNLTLADKLTYTNDISDVWGWVNPKDGKEYALVGAWGGLSIVDVSNPSNIVQVALIPGPASGWRDIRTVGNYAYVSTEGGSIGLQIVNLTNLPSANLQTTTWAPTIAGTQLKTIHALDSDGGKLFLNGTNVGNGGTIILDVSSNPTVPVYLGSYDKKYVHDSYVRNNILYASQIYDGTCAIVDISNPASPVLKASFNTPGNFTHNTGLSQDSKTLFTTDEINNSFLAAYDITNLSNITLKNKIQSKPGSNSVIHETYIINKNGKDYSVTSWYKDGVVVIDVSNPGKMVQVGSYDTSPLSGSGEDGCWGVYPYLPSGIILATDIQQGLFVLSASYPTGIHEVSSKTLKVTVSPNPLVSSATITVLNDTPHIGNYKLKLYDVMGKEVKPAVIQNSNSLIIERDNLLSGIYYYEVTSGETETGYGKLIVE